jgi:hypothetical protein
MWPCEEKPLIIASFLEARKGPGSKKSPSLVGLGLNPPKEEGGGDTGMTHFELN